MNLQQLEYIIAVDRFRHFISAAQNCHVTQATLSMMIKKLEDELGVKIFDRRRQPVIPTDIGKKIIAQAKIVLRELEGIRSIAQEEITHVQGELRIGIIPTLAPYLLPLFLDRFLQKYPDIRLQISELTTDVIIERIKHNQLDAGLLAIPVNQSDLVEIPLFNEEFVIYASQKNINPRKKYLLPSDLDVNKLWLLEEGHCLRNQVVNLCELKVHERSIHQFDLTASSIETLKKIVDLNEGVTVLPKLSLKDLSKKQMNRVRYFKAPVPVRRIGMVSFRYFIKEKMLEALKNEIMDSLPNEMKKIENQVIISI